MQSEPNVSLKSVQAWSSDNQEQPWQRVQAVRQPASDMSGTSHSKIKSVKFSTHASVQAYGRVMLDVAPTVKRDLHGAAFDATL